jgi:hypothetical protein
MSFTLWNRLPDGFLKMGYKRWAGLDHDVKELIVELAEKQKFKCVHYPWGPRPAIGRGARSSRWCGEIECDQSVTGAGLGFTSNRGERRALSVIAKSKPAANEACILRLIKAANGVSSYRGFCFPKLQ